MSCDVKKLIYVIRCVGCGLEYIGEMGDLRKRVTVHNQQIRDPTLLTPSFGNHLFACHLVLKHLHANIILSVFCIPKVLKGATKILKIG